MLATNKMKCWPTASEARLLARLVKMNTYHRVQPTEIAEAMDMEATTANNFMRRLEKKGLTKAFPRDDRPRAYVWAITPLGYRVAELTQRLMDG